MKFRTLVSAAALISATLTAMPAWAQWEDYQPVTDEMLVDPADGDWLLWRRSLKSWGYSPLDQINTENVDDMVLDWGWAMEPGWQETAPIVYDGVMYIANPDGILQALDATNGELLWEYRREMPEDFRSGMMSRGIAIYGDKVFFATPDAAMVALDVKSGQVVWEATIAEDKTVTAAPVAADGKIIAGYQGCSRFEENKCGVVAFDPETGEELWRTITVGDAEVGEDTWGGQPYVLRGGGDVWTSASYDPEQDLVYIGVSQAKPWARVSRGTGDEATLYTSSTLALNPDTGEIEWYRQYIPGETNDMDEAFETILVDIDGEPSYVNMGKLAILWRGSRVDGEPLPAFDLGWQNQIDLTENGEFAGYREGMVAELEEAISFCPSTSGFRSWRAMSFSPETRAVYIPMAINCELGMASGEVEMVEGGGGNGRIASERGYHPDSPDDIGRFVALNIDSGEVLWEKPLRTTANTAMLSTAGGLVFGGDWDRHMWAFDEATGEILWETRLPQAAQGYPISYAVDGKQYIAIPVGVGGYSWSSSIPEQLTPEVSRPSGGNAILVFSLADQE